ncbi:MAG: serine/threonine protein phosphatase [Roseivivax sp.]|nr:serine/threonine protein phosphatase [Roseivivax sp.]
MVPVFAIGDIHGQADMLDEALSLIHDDPLAGAHVVFLGDYVDRGPDSRGVIETLIEGLADGEPWITLRGNHDEFLLRFLENPAYRDPHTKDNLTYLDPAIGGRATLASYGVDVGKRRKVKDIHADALAAIPKAHVAFLRALRPMHVTADHVFVHAGIRPGVPLEQQDPEDLMWIRREFLFDLRDHGRLVVHGHTAIDIPVHHGNRVNLDGGAGHGRPLVPALLLGREVFTLSHRGRIRL